MRNRILKSTAAAAASLCALLAAGPAAAATYQLETVMTGLVTPRGLAFAPDGALYVTEAGSGGGAGGPAIGASFMGYTGAVSRWVGGVQSRVLTGLPSVAKANGSDAAGLQDIVFDAGGKAWGVFGLGGTAAQRDAAGAFGAPLLGTVAALKLDGSGAVAPIADIVRYDALNNPDGGPVDSNPYGLARTAGGDFVVADAGANAFFKATAGGAVSTLGVLPARPNPLPFGPPVFQSVPTAAAIGPDGDAYIGQLTGFPFPAGAANVYRHDFASGSTTTAYTGFTTIIDLDFDAAGNLYVLQLATNSLTNPGGPGSGVLIRITPDGKRKTLVDSGLFFAGGVAIEEGGAHGPAFYVSTGTNLPGGGAVVRISAVPEPATWALLLGGVGLVGAAAQRRRAG